ncbi:MAG: glutathione synthase [Deltaproteobacteria bacterium]|nr:glutathione synthase [Deltaproteobacteria bacterium]
MGKLIIAAIIDPVHTLVPFHDTTLQLLETASRMGHRTLVCETGGLSLQGPELKLCLTEVVIRQGTRTRPETSFWKVRGKPVTVRSSEVDVILMRKDPPVDQQYFQALWMLDYSRAPVINEPEGIRAASEKLFALNFADWMPPTLVTARRDDIDAFCREQGGRIVLKPLDGFAGRSVYIWDLKGENHGVIWEEITRRGTRPVMAQRFLPAVKKGDKRILLWNGIPLGAINRVASRGEARSNLAAGGKAEPARITPRERELIDALAPSLLEHGLFFVGLDVIGGYLTEINVTSPTGLVELEAFSGVSHSGKILAELADILG